MVVASSSLRGVFGCCGGVAARRPAAEAITDVIIGLVPEQNEPLVPCNWIFNFIKWLPL